MELYTLLYEAARLEYRYAMRYSAVTGLPYTIIYTIYIYSEKRP